MNINVHILLHSDPSAVLIKNDTLVFLIILYVQTEYCREK